MKTILVDASRCLQCSNCWVACKDEHCDNDWSPIAAPQGDDQWWINVYEKEAASGAHMKLHRVPVLCQHCEDAPCIAAGGGAVYRREDGIVIIDPIKAKGKREIVDACPYRAVFWNEESELPQKCTMCAHLIDAGWEMPRCVRACPNDALQFVDADELLEGNLRAPLERLRPEFKTSPTVAYVNLPKLFVAGELATGDDRGCIEGALVTVVHQVTKEEWHGYSGTFGGFHVDVDKPGFYSVSFAKDGFKRKTITDVDLRESKGLETVRMWPTID